ncbi:class I adenylate-forming enzyme family protein [Nocardia sp. NPDC051832]|uniref:class I adenylate-forming enzyme family protein n=1 Tax=Nocardia sp. NPDC051832 TaxID=3155673 RepID=UPI00341AFD7A
MSDLPFTPAPDSRGVTPCHPEHLVREYLEKGWWQPETMVDIFDTWVRQRPDAAALTDPANLAALTGALPEELTWRQLHERVEHTAAALFANGIRQGDVVAVLVPNSVALVASYLALWRLGAVATPMPVSYRGHEISTIVAASGAVAIITVDKLQDRTLAQEVSSLGLRAVCTFTPGAPASLHPDTAVDLGALREYLAALEITINDRVTICWTSGTEAAPKGVPRCHGDWLAIGWGPQEGLETSTDSVILNPFPLVNMAGFAGSLLPWLLGGGHLVQHHPLDLPVFLGQIQKYGVTHTSMPPALLTMLLQRADLRGLADLSSLQKVGSGGAPLPPSVVRDWQEQFGIAVLNFFGSNEGVCLMGAPADIPDPVVRAQHLPNYSTRTRAWASRLAANTAVRLVDPATGAPVHAVGAQGELRLKGPSVFGGYLPGTAASTPFDADGYLCSGDVFELCGADGQYLRFVDRIKEIIIRGGMNIAPAEIEGLLQDHPAIAEVAVVGFPDAVLGEKCCAIVVPKPGASITLGEVTDHLRARDIASFKLPERLELASALPRNPVGKILRRQLRDELLEQG